MSLRPSPSSEELAKMLPTLIYNCKSVFFFFTFHTRGLGFFFLSCD